MNIKLINPAKHSSVNAVITRTYLLNLKITISKPNIHVQNPTKDRKIKKFVP